MFWKTPTQSNLDSAPIDVGSFKKESVVINGMPGVKTTTLGQRGIGGATKPNSVGYNFKLNGEAVNIDYGFDSSNVNAAKIADQIIDSFTLDTNKIETPVTSIAVSGMRQYIDPGFGFSFWYPSKWQVTSVSVQNQNKYPGGTITKQLNVTNGQKLITVEEFISPTFSITDSTGVGACPVCYTTNYYFDASTHTWMVKSPNGTGPGGTGIGYPYAVPANVSFNTMGGLHMLAGSQRFGANTIIPLSASNFVIVTVDGGLATGSDPKALANTVVATDPSVATPWSTALQIQTIQKEANAYMGL
jgi:hypothetical protein